MYFIQKTRATSWNYVSCIFMLFKLEGVCFVSMRSILLLFLNGRRLLLKNWRNIFPKYFRGRIFYCEASAWYGPKLDYNIYKYTLNTYANHIGKVLFHFFKLSG